MLPPTREKAIHGLGNTFPEITTRVNCHESDLAYCVAYPCHGGIYMLRELEHMSGRKSPRQVRSERNRIIPWSFGQARTSVQTLDQNDHK